MPKCPHPDGSQLKTHHDTVREAIAGVLAAHNVQVEQLTSLQLAEAVRQALAAGDFMRHVTVDGRQAVTYVPYRERSSALARLQQLIDGADVSHRIFISRLRNILNP